MAFAACLPLSNVIFLGDGRGNGISLDVRVEVEWLAEQPAVIVPIIKSAASNFQSDITRIPEWRCLVLRAQRRAGMMLVLYVCEPMPKRSVQQWTDSVIFADTQTHDALFIPSRNTLAGSIRAS